MKKKYKQKEQETRNKKQSWRKIFLYSAVYLAGFFALVIAPFGNVRADEETNAVEALNDERIITLRLEGPDATVFNDQIKVSNGCTVTDAGTGTTEIIDGYKAICALQKAQENGMLTYQVTKGGFGYSIDHINSHVPAADWSSFWILRQNNAAASLGISSLDVAAGDEILLAYGPWAMEPLSLAVPETVNVGDTVSLTAKIWSDTSNTFEPANTAITFFIDGVPTDAADGKLDWVPVAPGLAHIRVTASNKTRSVPQTVTVLTPLPAVTVNLRIETPAATILPGMYVDVPQNCTVTDTDGTAHQITNYKAICALQSLQERNVITYQVKNSSFGLFLDGINAVTTGPGFTPSWVLWDNNALANFGISDLTVASGDELLLTYGEPFPVAPLEIFADPPSASTIRNIHFFAKHRLDNGTLERYYGPLTFRIGNTAYQTASGTLDWTPESADTYIVSAETAGKTRSLPIKVLVTVATSTDTNPNPPVDNPPANNPPTNNPPSGSPSGGGCSSCVHAQLDVTAAIQFLINNQNANGSFDATAQTFNTDWVAIAFGTQGDSNAKDTLKNYLLTDPSPGTRATDYERRAMALMALGINPYQGSGTDYIAHIVGMFSTSTGQIGDVAEVNDDIFALFPLLKAGYTPADTVVASTTSFITSYQSTNGSWGSVDMTAAAIQALSLVPNLPGVSSALAAGKAYLVQAEHANGAFGFGNAGNVEATSWVMQAIAALGEQQTDWVQNGKAPSDYLSGEQQTDGGLKPLTDPLTSRIWATAYAIPGQLGKSWGNILTSFSLPTQNTPIPDNQGSSGSGSSSGTDTPSQNNTGNNSNSNNQNIGSSNTPTSSIQPETNSATLNGELPNETLLELARSFAARPPVTAAEENNLSAVSQVPRTQANQAPSVPIAPRPLEVENTLPPETERVTEDTASTPLAVADDTPDSGEQLTAAAPVEGASPIERSLRNIFRLAVTLATSLGAYLAWRVLQTLA